ncbi:unnamed protein product [Dibothriocephalus latus]|uniref:Uncharacterized protein n=1 Tax=Dibothriocephalus latus TaxID=60516 RepID=A0A3P7LQM6_DIBLA|nr:unnamed protein product [Dibothriocephalus latus]
MAVGDVLLPLQSKGYRDLNVPGFIKDVVISYSSGLNLSEHCALVESKAHGTVASCDVNKQKVTSNSQVKQVGVGGQKFIA